MLAGHTPNVTSPPFSTPIHRTASGSYPDPTLPSPTPSPLIDPYPSQQTPAPRPALFEAAASPATVPAKRSDAGSRFGASAFGTSTSGTTFPAMFSTGTAQDTSFSTGSKTDDGDGAAGSDPGYSARQTAAPAATASGWGSAFLQVPCPFFVLTCCCFTRAACS